MANLTIDGKNIKADKGFTILKAAKENGIEIPTLCYHQGLSPLGNCRLCVVEATKNSRTRVVTSCNYLVEEGLKVETKTENIISIRKTIVELLAAKTPNVKIIRELADEMGIDFPRFTLENEKCILCGLCVHVCSEYIGAHAITFSSHGTQKFVSAPLYRSAEDCIGCGACAEICPAQCITMQDSEEAKTYYSKGKEEVGPVRLIHNWNVRVSWKKCKSCGNPFPPPSPLNYLDKGQPVPKDFFDTCEKCKK
jgi:NADH dehydrogenase/NADH:ubiquinone oxidoreductase subunit G